MLKTQNIERNGKISQQNPISRDKTQNLAPIVNISRPGEILEKIS